MKKHYSVWIIVLLVLSGCATTDLQARPTCAVWKDQGVFGPLVATFANGVAVIKGKCRLGFWWCESFQTKVNEKNEISTKGPGLFNDFTTVAILKNSNVEYEKTFADKLVSSSPIEIDMEKLTAKRTVTAKAFGAHTSEQVLQFNRACKLAEAATGAIVVWARENHK